MRGGGCLPCVGYVVFVRLIRPDGKRGEHMSVAVQITAIICVTLVVICIIDRTKKK